MSISHHSSISKDGLKKKPFSNHLLMQLLDQSYTQCQNKSELLPNQKKQDKEVFSTQNYKKQFIFFQQNQPIQQIHNESFQKQNIHPNLPKSLDKDDKFQLNEKYQVWNSYFSFSNQEEEIYQNKQFKKSLQSKEINKQFQQKKSSSMKTNNQEEQSQQFKVLKDKMTQIQLIASMEIKLLKEKLQQKQKYTRNLENQLKQLKEKQKNWGYSNQYQMKLDAFTETDQFIKSQNNERQEKIQEQQIAILKQALIRHVRINKYLTLHFKQIYNSQKMKDFMLKIEQKGFQSNKKYITE